MYAHMDRLSRAFCGTPSQHLDTRRNRKGGWHAAVLKQANFTVYFYGMWEFTDTTTIATAIVLFLFFQL